MSAKSYDDDDLFDFEQDEAQSNSDSEEESTDSEGGNYAQKSCSEPHLSSADSVMIAVERLTACVAKSQATTMVEVLEQLECEMRRLQSIDKSLAMRSVCDLFVSAVVTHSGEEQDWSEQKKRLVVSSQRFFAKTSGSRHRIAQRACPFIRDGACVLTLGYSRVVSDALVNAAVVRRRRFSVLVALSEPGGSGVQMARELACAGVTVTLISDSAVGRSMNGVDLVLVGAAAIAENGGIVNKIGTFQTAMIASVFNKPFYVAAESFKFARNLYPLDQHDLPELCKITEPLNEQQRSLAAECADTDLEIDNSLYDFTTPQYITLLFTDLGVFTPSAVSDELIKLEQRLIS
jgi:translation initiation factor eIF-2B subunit alpha